MAVGDDAAAAGYSLVAGSDDRRQGYVEINRTRDYLAQLKTWATGQLATLSAALSGKADAAHAHDDRYFTESEVNSRLAAKANAFGGNVDDVGFANGPTTAAYYRSATGSGWYAVYMNNALQFMRNTSSRRYKEAEAPLDIDPALVLALQPVTYHRKGQPDGTRELGLIAEDVAALGVPHLVTWEEHKPGKWRPEAVRYEQVLPVLLLHVVKAQQEQINALKARLEEEK